VWWHVSESVHVVLVVETHGDWSHVLIWVESAETTRKSSQISNRSDLNHLVLVEVWTELGWRIVVVVLVHVVGLPGVVVLHFLWHWGKSHTFREIWKGIDKLSSVRIVMIEGAAFSKFAVRAVLAWLGFVV